MKLQRLFGFVLLVIGVILLIVGINASHGVADRVSHSFTGRFTEATTCTSSAALRRGSSGSSWC
jgi:hypothetical protein